MRGLLFFIICSISVLTLEAQVADQDMCKVLPPEEFYIMMNSANLPLIIDTRIWKEYRRERIPGARLAESVAVLKTIVDSFDMEQAIFIYCDDYTRSTVACSVLVDWGYTNVYDLEGGMILWKLVSYELDTKRIRRKKK